MLALLAESAGAFFTLLIMSLGLLNTYFRSRVSSNRRRWLGLVFCICDSSSLFQLDEVFIELSLAVS